MQAEIKIENDAVLARRVACDPWIRSPDRVRAAHGKRIKIAHWINPVLGQSAWVLDSIRMSLLYSTNSGNGQFIGDRNYSTESRIVNYDRCVIVHGSLSRISEIRLLSAETGRLLSGSNIYSGAYSYPYSLCLGTGFDPTNLSPIEALLHNEANRDLNWMGGALTGEWQDGIFNISTWPDSPEIEWTIPSQIAENINAWSRC
jgi:hypothetical protein